MFSFVEYKVLRREYDTHCATVTSCIDLFSSFVLSDRVIDQVMSVNISGAIALSGEQVTRQPLIKSMRLVKKETLKLISDWVSRSNDPELVLENFIPPLLDAVLLDYQRCSVAAAREPEVLSTMATIVNKLEGHITSNVPKIFDAVFQCTLDMINKNFEEFPEHRTNFYLLLQAVDNHCFPALLALPQPQFKLVLDSIIWAFKHTMRNVGDSVIENLMPRSSTQFM